MSFEAYQIAVRLQLINAVSPALATITRSFRDTNAEVGKLQERLREVHRLTAMSVAALGAGAVGLKLFSGLIKPAEEYAHQLNIMNMAGLSQVEIAQSVGAAWKEAGKNLTTTATGNLKALLDLRNVLGTTTDAVNALPGMQRMRTVLAASSDGRLSGRADDIAFSAAKALDIIGAAKDQKTFQAQSDAMTKVIVATQGRVTPAMYQSVFNYARQAKLGLSDEFKYQVLPTLMLENAGSGGGGGGSRGVGPQLAALNRVVVQGYINKKSLPMWQQLGYVDGATALHTTSSGTTVGGLRGHELEADNSFAWAQQLAGDITKKYGNLSQGKMLGVLNELFRGNQLAASLVSEYIIKAENFKRDQGLILGTMSTSKAYESAIKNDPVTAELALKAQFNNLRTAFAMNVIPVLIPAMNALAKGLNELGEWARRYPKLTRDLVIGFGSLSGALAFGGVVIGLTAAFKGLGIVLGFGGASGAVGLIGSLTAAIGGPTVGLVGALSLLYGVTKLMGKGLTALDGGDVDPVNHPGQRRVHHGHAVFWERDMSVDQTHYGEHRVGGGRGGVRWVPDVDPTGKPASSPIVQVNSTINLDGKKVASVVTKHQVEDIQRAQRGAISRPDFSMVLPPVSMGPVTP